MHGAGNNLHRVWGLQRTPWRLSAAPSLPLSPLSSRAFPWRLRAAGRRQVRIAWGSIGGATRCRCVAAGFPAASHAPPCARVGEHAPFFTTFSTFLVNLASASGVAMAHTSTSGAASSPASTSSSSAIVGGAAAGELGLGHSVRRQGSGFTSFCPFLKVNPKSPHSRGHELDMAVVTRRAYARIGLLGNPSGAAPVRHLAPMPRTPVRASLLPLCWHRFAHAPNRLLFPAAPQTATSGKPLPCRSRTIMQRPGLPALPVCPLLSPPTSPCSPPRRFSRRPADCTATGPGNAHSLAHGGVRAACGA